MIEIDGTSDVASTRKKQVQVRVQVQVLELQVQVQQQVLKIYNQARPQYYILIHILLPNTTSSKYKLII